MIPVDGYRGGGRGDREKRGGGTEKGGEGQLQKVLIESNTDLQNKETVVKGEGGWQGEIAMNQSGDRKLSADHISVPAAFACSSIARRILKINCYFSDC